MVSIHIQVTAHLEEISRQLTWCLPQVFAYYPPLTFNSLHLYRKYMMTKYAFFANKAERWKKDMAPLWGNFNICPHLDHLDLPSYSLAEQFSISSFNVWGNIEEPHQDTVYLLVCIGNTTEDRHYGISLVWVNLNQARASTMEKVVETLTACPSSGTDWPYALAQLYEGSCHTPPPKDKHLGILPQGKVGEPPVGRSASLMSANSFLPAHKWSIP